MLFDPMLFIFRAIFWLSVVALFLPVNPGGHIGAPGPLAAQTQPIDLAQTTQDVAQEAMTKLISFCLDEQETCEQGIDMIADRSALNSMLGALPASANVVETARIMLPARRPSEQ